MKKSTLLLSISKENLINSLNNSKHPPPIDDFFSSLNNLLHQCTNKNIRICRNHIYNFILDNNNIISPLLTYFYLLSINLHNKKTLHLVYLIHDVKHDLKRRGISHLITENDIFPLFSISWDILPNRSKLKELINIWKEQELFIDYELFNENNLKTTYYSPPSFSTHSLPTITETYLSKLKSTPKPPLYTLPASFSLSSSNSNLLPSSNQVKDALNEFHNDTRNNTKINSTKYTYNGWTVDFESTNSKPVLHNSLQPDKLTTQYKMISENGIHFNAFKPPDEY